MSTQVPEAAVGGDGARPAAAACGSAAAARDRENSEPGERAAAPGRLRVWESVRSERHAWTPWWLSFVPQYTTSGGRASRRTRRRRPAAAARRVTPPGFVVGCCRHRREGGPVSVDYVQQQLGANEKILYTERHHWVFFVAEMIKWILFAAAVLALVIVLRVWWLPGRGLGLVAAARLPRPRGAHRLGLPLVAHERLRAHQPARDRVDRACSASASPTPRSRSSPTSCSSSRSSGACSTTATSSCSRPPPAPASTT